MKVIDKIRAMTTEEVANAIYKFDLYGSEFDSFCRERLVVGENDDLECPYGPEHCEVCIKEWLESEVDGKCQTF